MKKWYIKDRFGRYLSDTGMQFTRQILETGNWDYHTKKIDITHSKKGAKRFDKQKNALEFVRRYPELKRKHEAAEIYLIEE